MKAERSIAIRRIAADQGLILRAMRLRSLADAPEAFGQPIDEAKARPDSEWHQSARRSAAGDSRTWLFAHAGDDVVGLVQGRRRAPATLLLFSMWVAPEVRRRGVGASLVESLERWAVRWGARETILWVYATNRRAIEFYGSLAFQRITSGADRERGAHVGAIAMRRRIAAHTS